MLKIKGINIQDHSIYLWGVYKQTGSRKRLPPKQENTTTAATRLFNYLGVDCVV